MLLHKVVIRYIDHPELFEQADIIEKYDQNKMDCQEVLMHRNENLLFDPWWRKRNEGKCDRSNSLDLFSQRGCGSCEEGDVLATIYGNIEEKVKQAVLHFKENLPYNRRKINETDNDRKYYLKSICIK